MTLKPRAARIQSRSSSTGNRVPSLRLERKLKIEGYVNVAGVDEVGRGSWAGPLVACAVILPLEKRDIHRRLHGVRDSKVLSPSERLERSARIMSVARAIGIGWVNERLVDRIGLQNANRLAMQRAVAALRGEAAALIIDHLRLPNCALHQICLPRAEDFSLSVAAASIVAKVTRDRWMEQCDGLFPQYGFACHKGYGTKEHRDALATHGPCALHRLSFRPVTIPTE
jgi:ribonuclease HII